MAERSTRPGLLSVAVTVQDDRRADGLRRVTRRRHGQEWKEECAGAHIAASTPVVKNPPGLTKEMQKDSIDAVNALNRLQHGSLQDPEILTRVAQYEMAFRMQASVPDLVDMSKEPQHVLEAYGAKPGDGSFASNCLLARRLAERGVRFIQLYHRDWDHHSAVKAGVQFKSEEVD